MNKAILILMLIVSSQVFAQRINPHIHDNLGSDNFLDTGSNLSNDTNINVVHYNIDVEIALDSAFISGNVTIGLIAQTNNLSQIVLDFDSAYTIDSIGFPVSSFNFSNNRLQLYFQNSVDSGEYLQTSVFYHGIPVLAGGYKGLRYENHDNNEIIIATLSTPYLAHTWWPCKDGTLDKSDSTFVNITIVDTTINSIPVMAISNGLLDTVIVSGKHKTYCWKHYYPIVPYYVMIAISNYRQFNQIFEGDNYNFPIDYYVFDSHYDDAVDGVYYLPEVMEFFTEVFGPYPFLNEKYGMTQLGYYGAIENQTNTITNNMSFDWFWVSVHELGHMWFADMITCNTWHHGWLNEGFASYSEALFSERKFDGYHNYMKNFEYYGGGTVYLEDVSNPFNVFQSIIYNKGAYVLHMLRGVVGDSVFFDIIYEYANNNNFKYGNATTEEFQSICENVSGLDLDYFFEQWIYDERYPRYFYNYSHESDIDLLQVAIIQEQESLGWREVFEMPMQIVVDFLDGTDTILNVYNNEKNSLYSFSIDKEIQNVSVDPNKWILRNTIWDPGIIVGDYDTENTNFELYPNPSNGSFYISLDELFTSEVLVEIYDLAGRSQKFDIESNNQKIEILGLENGFYTLRIKLNDTWYTNTVIVSK